MNREIPQWMLDEVAAYDLEMTPAPRTVLDIGANIGAFALRVHAQWPEAAIRCYEPVKENYRELVKNVSSCRKIQAYRFAVRSFRGTGRIFMGDRGVTCGFHQLGRQRNATERVMCVDAAGIPAAEFVKVDAEGCEVEIVSRLDLKKTRALVVEYHRIEDIQKIKDIAFQATMQLIEEKAASETHGVLKFGRTGTTVSKNSSSRLQNPKFDRKIYVAVCSHFSNHDLIFLQSMMQLILGATVRISFGWSCDPSVERARNVLTANFLATDCTHLLFIDSDIAFSPRDVARIVSHDEEVVGGIYPLKTMDREVQWCGNQLGMAPDAAAVEGGPGTMPGAVRPDGLQEVGCIGTGFLCIARSVFEKMMEMDGGKIRYEQDWPPHRQEFAFWRQTVREVNGRRRFLTEDWNFCYRWRELGGTVFADTQVVLRHAGRAVWPLDLQQGNPFARAVSHRGPNAAPAAPLAATPERITN